MLEMSRRLCEHGDALPRPEGSRHAETNHIRALLDCIDFCATCVSFLLRDSPARVRDSAPRCAMHAPWVASDFQTTTS